MVMPEQDGWIAESARFVREWFVGELVMDRRMIMAQVIEFYIPSRFKQKVKWVPVEQRGKILAFPADLKKSA